MFPVGFFTYGPISSPILSKNGSFLSFETFWYGGRNYPIDMAGFAVSVKHFIEVSQNSLFPTFKDCTNKPILFIHGTS